MRLSPNTIKQIILFGIVGVISLVIDTSVTWFLYEIIAVPVAIASIVGFFSAFAFNFPVNRKRVFHHTDNDRYALHVQIALYAALLFFNAGFTAVAAYLLVKGGLSIVATKILLTALIAIWNFLLFRYVVFAKQDENN
ncbi:MAG: GtrA family protein [Candidatus Saccharimonas sp.]